MEYLMDKLGENHSEAIVVELLSVHQLLTGGVALIQMAMVGRPYNELACQPRRFRRCWPLTQLNGMTR